MTIGPKGQVVIPIALRKALKIVPGSKVIFKIDGDKIILEKLKTDSISVFRDIAKKGKSINKIAYDEYKNEILKRNEL